MTAVQVGRSDGSTSWIDSQDSARVLQKLGGSIGGRAWGGMLRMREPLGALDTAGGVLSILNPFSRTMIIGKMMIYTTTKSTGASTVDFGVAATSISNDTLLDGLDLGTATGLFDNITNKGTNGLSKAIWAATGYITGSMASGAAAGLVGYAYIELQDV